MSHLHDMEELVDSIQDNQVKNYMEEALSCYMARAYRACIVLTYIALFDDIVKKLGELGKINRKARKIYDEAQKKMNAQNVYESYLIDQLKSNSLLPSLDSAFLEILRVLRNKSAHPSGHNASAEEARFIFFEAIDRFLSKPILSTTQLVDDILSRLDEKHFFPLTDIIKISEVVETEIKSIHYEAFPYLIDKFLEKSLSSNSDTSKNAIFFLTGLAYLKNSEISQYLRECIIESKCSNSNYSQLIMQVISANGSLALDLRPVTYERLKSIISEKIRTVDSSLRHTKLSHPSKVIRSIVEHNSESFVLNMFEKQLVELFKDNIFGIGLFHDISNSPEIIKLYLEEVYEQAGSYDFTTANHFSNGISNLDSYLSKFLEGEQVFLIICNIHKAARNGAFDAESIRDSKFSTIPKLKNLSIQYITDDRVSAKAKYEDVIGNADDFEVFADNYF